MDKQRHMQRSLSHDTRTTTPEFKSPLQIEKQAAELYTREIFYDVQSEIFASIFSCSATSVRNKEGCKTCTIQDREKDVRRKGDFKVVFNEADRSAVCSCKHYERYGILCRHIFYVLRLSDIEEIPNQYVLRRWTKDALLLQSSELSMNRHQLIALKDDTEKLVCDIYRAVGYCVGRLGNDTEKLGVFRDKVHEMMSEIDADLRKQAALRKKDVIESLLGTSQPTEVTIQVSKGIRNKGCGTGKRLIGERKKASIKGKRRKRICKACGIPSLHDNRNCPTKYPG